MFAMASSFADKLAALDDSDEEDETTSQVAAERAKTLGNEAFGRGEYGVAVKHFGSAIRLTPKNHVLYSNRSGAHAALGHGSDALSDANECIKLAPSWAKGYSRKGAALVVGGQYKEALKAYKAGLEIEPQNAGLLKGLEDLRVSLREGELPVAADADRSTDATPQPPPPKPKPQPAPATAPPKPAGPVGEQWIKAAKSGNRAEMEALLKAHGSELDLVRYKARGIGHTAMHWAAASGERSIMEWLLGLGADVNALNTSESSVLHSACSSGQAFSVEWLLSHGADASLVNDDGETAAQVAAKKGRKDLSDKIESHLKDPVPQAATGAATSTPAAATSSSTAASSASAAAFWEGHEEEVD